MDKQKRALSREIDAGIVACALGQGCDEAGLMNLAIEYATQFRCQYQLSAAHMRSLETDAERATAQRMEANVNKVIRVTIRRLAPGLTGMSWLTVTKFTDQPKPVARVLMRTCNCTASRRSPKCKMPVEFCKHTALHHLVPRQSPQSPRSPRSPPKTPRSPKSGGTRKAKSNRR